VDSADETLLAAFQAGDESALATLLEKHLPAVYRFGVKMCRDPEDAKDVTQETLLAAARGLRTFRGASSLSTWLFTIARSFCIKRRRRRAGAPNELVSLDSNTAKGMVSGERPPDEAVGDRRLAIALDAAIAALEPMYREVLVLRDVEGLTAPEVAAVLGLGVDAVKSRLHRARAAVRSRLVPVLPSSEPAGAAACPDIVPIFSRYMEGEIGPDECARMQAHVESCPLCRGACNALKRTLVLCRAASHEDAVPREVQALVRKALDELQTSRSQQAVHAPAIAARRRGRSPRPNG
jgi:RNA polymerase sigma-70 factor (ECF subfamily)